MSRTLYISEADYTTMVDGFSVADLRKAFNLVCDPTDVRGVIDAVIPAREAQVVRQAVIFFTGDVPTIADTDTPSGVDGAFVRVTSAGYRNGPCGP